MKLSHEVKFLLQGGNVKDLKLNKGKYSQSVLNFLADNQIPY